MGNWEIKNSEALNWLNSQELGSFQLFILDPPYNVGFQYREYKDQKPQEEYLLEQLLVLARCKKLLKPGGSIFYLNYPETLAEIWGRVDFLKKVEILTWVYHSHLGGWPLRKGTRTWAWLAKEEPYIKAEAFQGEYRNPEDPRIKERMEQGQKPQAFDWFLQEQVKNTSEEKRNHPCQIPQDQVERFILGCSKPGDQVGDCYLGSGTTALAALKLGRAFRGCELDPEYVKVAVEALERVDGQLSLISP